MSTRIRQSRNRVRRGESQLEQAGSQQSTEFASFDENGNISPDSTRANSSSVGPIEDVSEDLSKMNRGTDVITKKERAKMVSKQLEEAEVTQYAKA
jgi:hypothetical protein